MSRLKKAISGVFSSYVLLGAAAVYSLASVPVALHFLNAPDFGLWVLMGSISGYFNLIDLGMTGAAARLLIDYKDDTKSGEYGSLVQTSVAVSLVQGLIIMIMGVMIAHLSGRFLKLEGGQLQSFIKLFDLQCVVIMLMFSTRIFGMLLTAHQRMDIGNYANVVGLLFNILSQVLFFKLGWGVLSLSLGALASTLLVLPILIYYCIRLDFLPARGCWGRVSRAKFLEVFSLGKDLFLVSLGTQLIMASQSIVLTRTLGIEASAAWGVGTRVFNLLNQIIWKISDMSGSAFAEMITRGEIGKLRLRYETLTRFTASLAGVIAVIFAACNSGFVAVWAHHKIPWNCQNDIMLGLWMIVLAVFHCHGVFVLLTKEVRMMKYVYFVEGVFFVLIGIPVSEIAGIKGLILCSILCNLCFSGSYSIHRIARYFKVSFWEVACGWMLPMPRLVILLGVTAVIEGYLLIRAPEILSLITKGSLLLLLGGVLLIRTTLRGEQLSMISTHLPLPFRKTIHYIAGA